MAAKNGHVDVINAFIERGADINPTDDDGWSPIHAAVHNGQVHVLESLLASTSDEAATMTDELNVVQIANENGKDVNVQVECFLKRNANIDATTNDG